MSEDNPVKITGRYSSEESGGGLVQHVKVQSDQPMTVADLEAFCKRAREMGATGRECPQANVTIGGRRIKSLELRVEP